MCRPVKCKTCGKTTWAGCGQHIAQVKASVPAGNWCPGKHTPVEKAAATGNQGGQGGLLSRIFGRS